MAIVVYKCDVCKREKEFIRNIEGIEKIQRCTITHGCRGKLFQVKVLSDYIRASTSPPVLGLDDWRQRKVLYNHTQTIARDVWNIEHNLGTFPAISAFVNIPTEDDPDNLEEIIPIDTDVVDDNNMVLRFDRSWSGIAQLVARQSDPNLLKPFIRNDTISGQTLQQISQTDGEITIATKLSPVGDCLNIGLNVTYNTTQNINIDKQYIVSSDLSNSNSPWADFERVIIKGNVYTIRTYNGIYADMITEVISSGSTFKFTSIVPNMSCSPVGTTRDIARDEVYILFADKPYDLVDKNTKQYIDVFDITSTENSFSLVFNDNEFFAQSNIIQETYPPIRIVT